MEGNLKTIWSKKEIPDLINFNLNYLGFLSSPLPLEKKKLLFESHIESSKKGINKFSYEPFVVSVKLIECIRFLTLHSIKKLKYDTFLFSQAKFLLKRLEKDLLGNHYLFNGLGLLYAAYYFNDKIFLSTAEKIIIEQLSIQFLNDGMHYELSPMYQVIIINELLKCYDLLLRNNQDNEDTKMLIKDKLEHAMGFYNFISIDGFYPNLNDSYFSYELKNDLINSKYHILGLKPKSVLQGKDSGLRKYTSGLMTLIFDSGQIGPNHQPGHAHADSLTFCLYYDSSPMIVDTGTSVYENTERRYLERSTESHNTIKYKNLNSSEVWSSFRVGRIAKTFIEKEGKTLSHLIITVISF